MKEKNSRFPLNPRFSHFLCLIIASHFLSLLPTSFYSLLKGQQQQHFSSKNSIFSPLLSCCDVVRILVDVFTHIPTLSLSSNLPLPSPYFPPPLPALFSSAFLPMCPECVQCHQIPRVSGNQSRDMLNRASGKQR